MTRTQDTASMVIAVTAAVVGLLPIACWLSVLTFACRAAVFLGHWPSYNYPDPNELPDNLAFGTAWLDWGVPIASVVLFAVGLALFLRKAPAPSSRLLTGAKVLFGGWIVGATLLIADPSGIIEWFVD